VKTIHYLLTTILIFTLAGCGAVFVNQGAKNATLAQDLAPPEIKKSLVKVPADQKIIGNFEYSDKNINRNLYGKPDGAWIVVTWGANKINGNFIAEGGADHTQMAAHVFGTLIDRGDSQYPGFMLMGRFKNNGTYDASPFNGIRFFYKCPLEDNAPKRRFSIATSQTVPVANGGTCKRGCWNHYGADMESSDEWQKKSYAFTDLKRESGWGSPVMPPDITDHLMEFINLQWANSGTNMPAKYNIDYWVDEIEFF
jgi:hypothetical protein